MDSARGEGLGHGFATAGDLFRNRLFIDSQGQGPANPWIVERRAGDIEAVEISGQEGARMKIRAATKLGNNQGRNHALIEKQIGLS